MNIRQVKVYSVIINFYEISHRNSRRYGFREESVRLRYFIGSYSLRDSQKRIDNFEKLERIRIGDFA